MRKDIISSWFAHVVDSTQYGYERSQIFHKVIKMILMIILLS
jgi:hypothetical protein